MIDSPLVSALASANNAHQPGENQRGGGNRRRHSQNRDEDDDDDGYADSEEEDQQVIERYPNKVSLLLSTANAQLFRLLSFVNNHSSNQNKSRGQAQGAEGQELTASEVFTLAALTLDSVLTDLDAVNAALWAISKRTDVVVARSAPDKIAPPRRESNPHGANSSSQRETRAGPGLQLSWEENGRGAGGAGGAGNRSSSESARGGSMQHPPPQQHQGGVGAMALSAEIEELRRLRAKAGAGGGASAAAAAQVCLSLKKHRLLIYVIDCFHFHDCLTLP